ncbi:hypothetical protein LPJ53_002537 [Coemansia erecta]|uniref:Uncharacterized protein n=1 Tax=Coemansia erecta TaxID=147472 RepID=A0A9W7Y208_9FUNG|nr:hypothetical protein LPJ53_002537 [Coemansia erecta]
MFHYPPAHNAEQPSSRYYGQLAHIGALQSFAKKKRYDISIGLQAALSIIYTAELVYYFIRLRHLAGTQPAAWRASLMMILLILDVGMIWLTFRSKKAAIIKAYVVSPVANGGGAGFGGYDADNNAPYATPMNRIGDQNENRGPYHADAPRAPEPLNLNSTHPSLPHYTEPRSHLNTPITE